MNNFEIKKSFGPSVDKRRSVSFNATVSEEVTQLI
tara:strand:+ start:1605 stop:1709 length:105 start_codon:yes stop_codon:yes gene_type:complete